MVTVIETTPPPLAGDTEVRLRMLDVGVCGTDAEICRFEYGGPNGVFVFTGVPGRKAKVEIAADAIMLNLVLRNQTILGTVSAARSDYEAAVRDLVRIRAEWPGALEALITGRDAMSRFCERAAAREGIKDVIAVAETE
jgi:threonine dehydrogenase-like Zn-dependent dehydrogenase